MKGETIMKRFRLLMMTASRSRRLLITAFAVAATLIAAGISITYAQGSKDIDLAARQAARQRQVPAALKDKIAAKRAADAEHARAVRNAAIMQRKKELDYNRRVLQGQGQAPAPDTGGAK